MTKGSGPGARCQCLLEGFTSGIEHPQLAECAPGSRSLCLLKRLRLVEPGCERRPAPRPTAGASTSPSRVMLPSLPFQSAPEVGPSFHAEGGSITHNHLRGVQPTLVEIDHKLGATSSGRLDVILDPYSDCVLGQDHRRRGDPQEFLTRTRAYEVGIRFGVDACKASGLFVEQSLSR